MIASKKRKAKTNNILAGIVETKTSGLASDNSIAESKTDSGAASIATDNQNISQFALHRERKVSCNLTPEQYEALRELGYKKRLKFQSILEDALIKYFKENGVTVEYRKL